MKESNRTVKTLGKQMLKGHFPEGFVVLFIIFIANQIPSLLIDYFAPDSTIVIGIYNAYVLLITGPLKLGACIFFLSCMRGECIGINSIGYGFDYFGKAVALYINVTFRIMIWGMLFIVPGIIMFIRLSQSFYVLADDPGKSVAQCMQESKDMMKMNVGRYIVLQLGFLVYYFVAEIPRFFVSRAAVNEFMVGRVLDEQTYLQAMQVFAYGASGSPYSYLTLILEVFIDVFRYICLAAFFELVSGKLVVEHEYNEEI